MKSNEEWLRTLYICLLVIAFIALSTVAAQRAFALSPLPDGGWELQEDDAGLPVMINRDNEKGVLFSFGYQNSKHCGDVRMIIGNMVPGKIADVPEEEIKVPSLLTTPSTPQIPLPAIPITFMEINDDTVLMLYVYTPTDKLVLELMNAPIFTWQDPAFKEGHRATFNNESFVDTLNSMMERCLLEVSTEDEPEEEEEGDWTV